MVKRLSVLVGLALGALLIFATPAQAQSNIIFASAQVSWSANGESTIVDHDTVRLQGDNTSVETAALGINVNEGDEISFRYELLEGAECVGGAPRVFVIINGANTNSWDQLQPTDEQCGIDGLVTFTAGNAGLITTAGIVYDNSAGGAVEVSNLTVDGTLVLFQEPATDPSPTPSEPTPSPTPTMTSEPDPAPSQSASGGGGADKELPETGTGVMGIAGIGAGLVAAGAGLYFALRRRRSVFTA